MPTIVLDGVRLFYEVHGSGVPLVLVHGSWDSHRVWDLIARRLAEVFQVVTYDRRGHSQSERLTGQGSVREDVADLSALIRHLKLIPAWVVGNSFGGSIALRLAGEHPEQFLGVIAHEPPLFSLLADEPGLAPLLAELKEKIGAIAGRIAAGDHAGATERFVETVALGPGTWATIPSVIQQAMIDNAPTFLDEANDREALAFEREWLSDFSKPTLLTLGDRSPPAFAPVVARLSQTLPHAEIVTLAGAGHVPHETHPEAYAEAVISFIRKHGG